MSPCRNDRAERSVLVAELSAQFVSERHRDPRVRGLALPSENREVL